MGLYEDAQVADAKWRVGIDRDIKELKERADEHFERLEEHAALLAEGDKRMTELAGAIATNTTITQSIKTDTTKVVAAFNAWGGFTTVGRWLLAVIVGASTLIIAGAVIYWFVSTGTLPRPQGYQPAPAIAASPSRS